MLSMISQQIRRNFLRYFQKKGHVQLPSSSVVPHEDPSLLFTNAGMNQFKDVFLGKSMREYTQATTSQKCIRVGGKHNDLENVGHTDRHLTFFEMLGNFSFGDYFKEEAIAMAWEVTLEVFGFDPNFLWVTVLHNDEEAFAIWKRYVKEERIVRMSEKDNFWAMGDRGPCGPCSELYYDKGSHFGAARSPAEDVEGRRFTEFWNLVFMQYNREESGHLEPLKRKGVDTGAGLERICALKEGVSSLFETDTLRMLIASLEKITHLPYKGDPAFRVIADHFRCLAFAIADGVQPSNIERGYVLRKVVRRAVRYARKLQLQEPFLAKLLPPLLECMGEDYPELFKAKERIVETITAEEESFFRTLKRGGNLLGQIMEHSTSLLSGEDAFKLKDTYGLPLEEILLLAKDANLSVDLSRFEELELEAKEKSKSGQKKKGVFASASAVGENIYEEHAKTQKPVQFLGYELMTSPAVVVSLLKEGKLTLSLNSGEEGIVLLDKTPFYAEKGGQIGDTGFISSEEALFEVIDTKSPYADVIAHHGIMKEGSLKVGDLITATVDEKRRQKIANNHTATHLLGEALYNILGSHIKQAGSIVEPHRLRFDFNHPKSLTESEIQQIESWVNERIREDFPVTSYEISYSEAQQKRDIVQVFGEKYGKRVRVVQAKSSKELCGGTHTKSVGTIGYFRIVKEGSISSGVRRIEAVTGVDAEDFVREEEKMLQELASLMKVAPSLLVAKVGALLEENQKQGKDLAALQEKALVKLAEELLEKREVIKGVTSLVSLSILPPGELKILADLLASRMEKGVIFLASQHEGRCHLVSRVTGALPFTASSLMQAIAPLVGGKGGGKAHFAQGGGTEVEKLQQAVEQARAWILSNLS